MNIKRIINYLKPLLLEVGEINSFFAERYIEELEFFYKKIEKENDKEILWNIFSELESVRKEVTSSCAYCYHKSYEEEERKALNIFLDLERTFLNLEEMCMNKIYA